MNTHSTMSEARLRLRFRVRFERSQETFRTESIAAPIHNELAALCSTFKCSFAMETNPQSGNRGSGQSIHSQTQHNTSTQTDRQTDSVLCEIPRHAAKAQMYLFVYTHYTYLNVCTYILFLCAYVIDGTASEFFSFVCFLMRR